MIEFEIPKALPSWNQYWAGVHWSKRAATALDWRVLVAAAVRKQYGELAPVIVDYPVTLVVTVEKADHILDCSNVCVKVLEDALKPWLLQDDSPGFVSCVVAMSALGPRNVTTVRIYEEGERDGHSHWQG